MGLIFAKNKCDNCNTDNKEYDNPILTFNCIGKRHGTSICLRCLLSKVILKNNTSIKINSLETI